MRAKSRLKPELREQLVKSPANEAHSQAMKDTVRAKVSPSATSSSPDRRSRAIRGSKPSPRLAAYLQRLPVLFLFGGSLAALIYILTAVSPATIKDLPLHATYGPLLLAVFLSIFFGLSFALLNSRRGLLIALAITFLLFLKLQSILITPILILGTVAVILSIELPIFYLSKRAAS